MGLDCSPAGDLHWKVRPARRKRGTSKSSPSPHPRLLSTPPTSLPAAATPIVLGERPLRTFRSHLLGSSTTPTPQQLEGTAASITGLQERLRTHPHGFYVAIFRGFSFLLLVRQKEELANRGKRCKHATISETP